MPVRSRSRCCSDGDVLPAAVAQLAQFVELGVVARRIDAAVGERRRRTLRQRARPARRRRRAAGRARRARVESAALFCSAAPASAVERLEHVGQPQEGVAERAEFARRGAARGGPAGQPLEVAHAVERLAQPRRGRGRRAAQASTASSRASIAADVAERREHPLPQQPAAHRRQRAVDRLQQRGVPGARHAAARPAPGCGGSSRRARDARRLRRTTGRDRCGTPPGCSSAR